MTTQTRLIHAQEARESLLRWLAPGDTVYTVLRHVSSSGMSRRIDVCTIKDNKPIYLTSAVATLLDLPHPDKGDGLRISGAGMDMGFKIVYDLSRALFRGETEDQGRDAGYALDHRWI